MTQEHDVLKFKCGGPLDVTSDAPVFNDLADTRDWALDERVGLLRAVELVRAIGGSEGCMRAPDLVIDDLDDLADPTDRAIVALLLEPAGSRLFVGSRHFTADVLDRNDDVGNVLRLFADVPQPERLESRDAADKLEGRDLAGNWKQAAARYLCSDLGLTGEHAAWAMNLVTSPGRFNDKSMRYYATKPSRAIDPTDGFWSALRSYPMTVRSIGDQFQRLLGSPVTLLLPEKLPPDVDRSLFHAAALIYNEFQPGSLEIPDTWPTPSLNRVPKKEFERAMRVIAPVRRRTYARRPWPPADQLQARKFAMKRAAAGHSMRDIAAALNEKGYRVSRKGGWHYRSVVKLLQPSDTSNPTGERP